MLGDIINWAEKHSYALHLVRYLILLVLYILVLIYWANPHMKSLDQAEYALVLMIGFEVGVLTCKYVVDGLAYVYNAYH
jgi:hypothetical protein